MKPNKPYTSLDDVVQQCGSLQHFASKLKVIEALAKSIASILPDELKPHCTTVNIRDGAVILATHAPEWKHKLRFAMPDILSQLREFPQWCGISHIEVIILNESENQENLPPANPLPSFAKTDPYTAKIVSTVAQSIKNEKLSNSLQRLAKRISK